MVIGRKKDSIETKMTASTRQKLATYYGGKERAYTDLEFFPGSIMLVHWV